MSKGCRSLHTHTLVGLIWHFSFPLLNPSTITEIHHSPHTATSSFIAALHTLEHQRAVGFSIQDCPAWKGIGAGLPAPARPSQGPSPPPSTRQHFPSSGAAACTVSSLPPPNHNATLAPMPQICRHMSKSDAAINHHDTLFS